MTGHVKLVWTVQRDPQTGKTDPNEGIAHDGPVPVGSVSLAPGDPTNKGHALLAADPGNRQATHEHHAAVQESARLWESGEGLTRMREVET
jgi:hypothetical protein